MLKKTITYEDFEGNKVTETLQFNLTKTETMDFALILPDDVKDSAKEVTDSKPMDINGAKELAKSLSDKQMFDFVKELVGRAYGVKSDDNKHFRKSPEMRAEFEQSLAYDALIMELTTSDDPDVAMNFITGVFPSEVVGNVTTK